jgi:hypothetical protein
VTRNLFEQLPAPSCVLSDEQPEPLYRYELRLPLSNAGTTLLFLLANPSTAIVRDGHFTSDRTITKCIGYARRWKFGTLLIGNVRAWRSTNPKLVPADPLAIGPENDRHLRSMIAEAHIVVGGWGKLGGARGQAALDLLREAGKPLHALHLNADGSPQHPLYLSSKLNAHVVRP